MIDNAPLISVIVPVYNGEKYIRKCVDSILAQTYPHLEIILVDDGSVDKSAEICDEYAKEDGLIKVVHRPNGGLSAARNSGLEIARGEYFSFIDVDDWVAPEFIETLWKTATEYDAPVAVVGRYAVFTDEMAQERIAMKPEEKKLLTPQGKCFSTQETLQLLFGIIDGYVTNKMFHASLFKETRFPQGLTYEDLWTLYRLFPRVSKIAVYNTPLYYYNRQNENSLSRGKFRMSMLDYFKVTDDFVAEANTFEDKRMLHILLRERLAHICGFFKRMMISDFNDRTVIKPMQQQLRRNLWILLTRPRPLSVTFFGVACAISFSLTKQIFRRLPKRIKGC